MQQLDNSKKVLIKNNAVSLTSMSAHSLLIGMTAHMSRCATTLLTYKVTNDKGPDEDYRQLAINIHRLANDIQTFMNNKVGIPGGQRTP